MYINIIQDGELPPEKPEPTPTRKPSQEEDLILKSSSIIRGDGEIEAFIENFDPTGLFTIGWLKKMVPPENFEEIAQKTIVVRGEPSKRRYMQDINNKKSDTQSVDRIVAVKESQDEFEKFQKTILELDAIEVQFIDDHQNLIDLNYKWLIQDFTEDKLVMKFQFEDSDLVSKDFEFNDRIKLTFWDTSKFKFQDGQEIPFGAEIEWQVIRQM